MPNASKDELVQPLSFDADGLEFSLARRTQDYKDSYIFVPLKPGQPEHVSVVTHGHHGPGTPLVIGATAFNGEDKASGRPHTDIQIHYSDESGMTYPPDEAMTAEYEQGVLVAARGVVHMFHLASELFLIDNDLQKD